MKTVTYLSSEQDGGSNLIRFLTTEGKVLRHEMDVLIFIDSCKMNYEWQAISQDENELVEIQSPSDYLDENWEKVTNRFYNEVILKG